MNYWKITLVVMITVLLAGCRQAPRGRTVVMADSRLDEWMSAPANTPDGPTDTPSPIHTELWGEGRAAYEKKVAEKIAAEVKIRGLLNPGYPLGDMDNRSSQQLGTGENTISLGSKSRQATRIEGFIACGLAHPHRRVGERLDPPAVVLRINGEDHTVLTNKPFSLAATTGVDHCTVVIPSSQYHFELGELRVYR